AQSVKDANGSPAPQGAGLLAATSTGDTQLTMIGNGGTSQSATVSVTNTSPNTQVVSPHGRVLAPLGKADTGTLDAKFNDPTLPGFLDGFSDSATSGPRARVYQKTTFT